MKVYSRPGFLFRVGLKTSLGAGRVLRLGSKITKVALNDPVLLSFPCCGTCQSCQSGHPAHCPTGTSFRAVHPRFKHKSSGKLVNGLYFGQSSFSQVAVVRESSVIPAASLLQNPSSDEELKLFAPFGCGLMTGAGAVANVAHVDPSMEVVILGLGGVGMGALMAVKALGCKTIIAVDRVESRLQLAKELGATHTLNTSGDINIATDLGDFVRKASPEGYGVSVAVDTTAHVPLINAALDGLKNGGQMVLLGIPRPGTELTLGLGLLLGRALTVRAVLLGDAVPAEFVPKMITWYRKGQFPVEKLIKFFDAENMADAVLAMQTGSVVKPVITW
jgi:Zn-dependent alcohol dehydrogenase